MTEPTNATPPSEEPSPPGAAAGDAADPAPPTTPAAEPIQQPAAPVDPLDEYIRVNYNRYSEAALRQAALAAGNSPAAVDAALGRYRQLPVAKGPEQRAARTTLIAYIAVFAVLSIGMVLNDLIGSSPSGGSIIGIVVLGIVLAIGYALSYLWLRSRRGGLIVVGGIVALFGLSNLTYGGIVALAAVLVGGAMAAGPIFVGSQRGAQFGQSAAVLLSIPLLILFAIGGACVATGLPLPQG
jgi:hypothetical protein